MKSNHRVEWIDIAKGIGIILVVIGHCLNINEWPFHIIFTFHMPLFFLISGYLFKPGQSFPKFLKKRVRTLLVPYIIFFLLGLVVTCIIPEWRKALTLEGIVTDLVLADPNNVHNTSIWFLVCMFFVQILFWLIVKTPKWVQTVLLLLLYSAGMYYSVRRFPFYGYARLPLDLDVVPVAIMFYAIGYYVKEAGILEKISGNTTSSAVSFVMGNVVMVICYLTNGYTNMHGLQYGNPVLYLIGGLSGSLGVIALSRLIEGTGTEMVRSALCFYGRNSLIILGIQSLSIRLLILLFNHCGIPLQIYYLPVSYSVIFSVIVAFVWCPLVCLLWNKFKMRKN